MVDEGFKRKLAAILSADAVDYSYPSGFSKKGRFIMRIFKHVVWLIATALIINGCATYYMNETECNLTKSKVNPTWDAEKLDEAFQFACELGTTSLIVATNGEIVKSTTGEKLLGSGHGYLWWVPVDNKSSEMGIPEGTYVASGFGNQRIVVIPYWDTVIIHQVNVIDCVVSVMKKQKTTLKGAIIHLYMCKFPLFSFREDCQKCGFTANFFGSGFVEILSRIIDARITVEGRRRE